MITQKINDIISNSNFDSKIISLIDDIVFVNLDYLTNRQYQSQGVNEFLYQIGDYKNKVIVFLIRDGVNCRITGIRETIKHVITSLSLTKETCFHYGYDDLELENSTFIDMNLLQMWTHLSYEKIRDLPSSICTFEKKFAALYGRHDLYRLKFFRHLRTNYANDSLLAFNSINGLYNQRFQHDFANDIEWYQQNCPVFLDFPTSNNWVPYGESLEKIGKQYNRYFIEIVAETDFYSKHFFTEKTIKNFYLGKPFILWSGPNSLETLQDAGFITFHPYIDETYDSIANIKDRFDAIIQEIDRIAKLSIPELTYLNNKMIEIFQHNRKIFMKKLLTC